MRFNANHYSAILTCLLLFFSSCDYFHSEKRGLVWLNLEPGLSLGTYFDSQGAGKSQEAVYVLKIDPNIFDVNLFCASQFNQKSRSMQEWAKEFGLTAVINAGMFATDLSTSVGYLKSSGHLNNPRINSTYKCIFVCQPLDSMLSPAKIFDLTCEEFQMYEAKYHSSLQSIRMISCRQENVWEPQNDQWSIAALGIDKEDQLLFIYSFIPRSVHEFINLLLSLPLKIHTAMYLEGGIQAGLYILAGGIQKNLPWDNRPDILLNNDSQAERPLPNVIGVRRKPR